MLTFASGHPLLQNRMHPISALPAFLLQALVKQKYAQTQQRSAFSIHRHYLLFQQKLSLHLVTTSLCQCRKSLPCNLHARTSTLCHAKQAVVEWKQSLLCACWIVPSRAPVEISLYNVSFSSCSAAFNQGWLTFFCTLSKGMTLSPSLATSCWLNSLFAFSFFTSASCSHSSQGDYDE